MKKTAFYFPLVILIVVMASCAKTSSTGFAVSGKTSLWPLKATNTFVYQDSAFDTNDTLLESYTDSAYVNSLTTVISGVTFYGFTDSLGWFGTGSYLAVDPYNTTIYSLDSLNSTPYIFFQEASADGTILGTSQDFSNPSCIGNITQYGFASTYSIAGYSCYRNILTETDCNNNTIYTVVLYIAPGAGLVRVEEYSQIPGAAGGSLYKDYSQTLKSVTLH